MDKVFLTKDQALKLIGEGKQVHTFRNAGFGLFGCDISRESLIEKFDEYPKTLQLSGEQAIRMSHGIVIIDDTGSLFIETIVEELELFNK